MKEGEELKITTVEKVKDPKRVEAGKKLAQISKHAKERKLREKIQRDNVKEENSDYLYYVAIGGLVLTGISSYYT